MRPAIVPTGRTVRHPVRSARNEPVATALLLAGASITLVTIQRGAVPTGREAGYLGVGSVGLVLLAAAAPTLVVATLTVAFFAALLANEQIVLNLADQVAGALASFVGAGPTPAPGTLIGAGG